MTGSICAIYGKVNFLSKIMPRTAISVQLGDMLMSQMATDFIMYPEMCGNGARTGLALAIIGKPRIGIRYTCMRPAGGRCAAVHIYAIAPIATGTGLQLEAPILPTALPAIADFESFVRESKDTVQVSFYVWLDSCGVTQNKKFSTTNFLFINRNFTFILDLNKMK